MPISRSAAIGALALAAALVCGGDTFSAEDKAAPAASARSVAPASADRGSAAGAASTSGNTGATSGSQPRNVALGDSGNGRDNSAGNAASRASGDQIPPLQPWSNPTAAFRFGYNAYKTGDTQGAIVALAYAADRGHPAALWKLGRMYQTGDGVDKDERRAFALFSRIADEYADGNPHGPNARFVASAFVTLGGYHVDGVAGMQTNEALARRYFYHAALYYGDAEAQFRLAAMYLVGQGGAENVELAGRWFKKAAQKGHAGAQAEFGRLLFDGANGFAHDPVEGLMWLSIANASGSDDPHIRFVHDQAFALADEKERREASLLAGQWHANDR